jgi:hypothetical protein
MPVAVSASQDTRDVPDDLAEILRQLIESLGLEEGVFALYKAPRVFHELASCTSSREVSSIAEALAELAENSTGTSVNTEKWLSLGRKLVSLIEEDWRGLSGCKSSTIYLALIYASMVPGTNIVDSSSTLAIWKTALDIVEQATHGRGELLAAIRGEVSAGNPRLPASIVALVGVPDESFWRIVTRKLGAQDLVWLSSLVSIDKIPSRAALSALEHLAGKPLRDKIIPLLVFSGLYVEEYPAIPVAIANLLEATYRDYVCTLSQAYPLILDVLSLEGVSVAKIVYSNITSQAFGSLDPSRLATMDLLLSLTSKIWDTSSPRPVVVVLQTLQCSSNGLVYSPASTSILLWSSLFKSNTSLLSFVASKALEKNTTFCSMFGELVKLFISDVRENTYNVSTIHTRLWRMISSAASLCFLETGYMTPLYTVILYNPFTEIDPWIISKAIQQHLPSYLGGALPYAIKLSSKIWSEGISAIGSIEPPPNPKERAVYGLLASAAKSVPLFGEGIIVNRSVIENITGLPVLASNSSLIGSVISRTPLIVKSILSSTGGRNASEGNISRYLQNSNLTSLVPSLRPLGGDAYYISSTSLKTLIATILSKSGNNSLKSLVVAEKIAEEILEKTGAEGVPVQAMGSMGSEEAEEELKSMIGSGGGTIPFFSEESILAERSLKKALMEQRSQASSQSPGRGEGLGRVFSGKSSIIESLKDAILGANTTSVEDLAKRISVSIDFNSIEDVFPRLGVKSLEKIVGSMSQSTAEESLPSSSAGSQYNSSLPLGGLGVEPGSHIILPQVELPPLQLPEGFEGVSMLFLVLLAVLTITVILAYAYGRISRILLMYRARRLVAEAERVLIEFDTGKPGDNLRRTVVVLYAKLLEVYSRIYAPKRPSETHREYAYKLPGDEKPAYNEAAHIYEEAKFSAHPINRRYIDELKRIVDTVASRLLHRRKSQG